MKVSLENTCALAQSFVAEVFSAATHTAASDHASSKGTELEVGLCFSRPFAWASVPQVAAALAMATEANVDVAEKACGCSPPFAPARS